DQSAAGAATHAALGPLAARKPAACRRGFGARVECGLQAALRRRARHVAELHGQGLPSRDIVRPLRISDAANKATSSAAAVEPAAPVAPQYRHGPYYSRAAFLVRRRARRLPAHL